MLGWRRRAPFAASTEASNAAMRSITVSEVGAEGATVAGASPAALHSISSSTASRYESR